MDLNELYKALRKERDAMRSELRRSSDEAHRELQETILPVNPIHVRVPVFNPAIVMNLDSGNSIQFNALDVKLMYNGYCICMISKAELESEYGILVKGKDTPKNQW